MSLYFPVACYLAALIVVGVDLARTRGQSLTSWAVALVALGLTVAALVR